MNIPIKTRLVYSYLVLLLCFQKDSIFRTFFTAADVKCRVVALKRLLVLHLSAVLSIFIGWEVRIENSVTKGNCSASWCLPSDGEQISLATEFPTRTEQTNMVSFSCISSRFYNWICVVISVFFFFFFWLKYLHFSARDVRFGFYSRRWCRTFGGKWRKNWHKKIKTTFCWRHDSHLTPRCVRRHFLAPIRLGSIQQCCINHGWGSGWGLLIRE